MKEFFKQQLESAIPITQELLNELPIKNYDSGEPKQVGDHVLYAFKNRFENDEMTNKESFTLILISLCEREFDYYTDQYTISVGPFSGQVTIPILVNKGDEEKFQIMWDGHLKTI